MQFDVVKRVAPSLRFAGRPVKALAACVGARMAGAAGEGVGAAGAMAKGGAAAFGVVGAVSFGARVRR